MIHIQKDLSHEKIVKKLATLLLILMFASTVQAQDIKDYYIAYEFVGETVYTNHSRWRFEIYSSSIIVNDGKYRCQFNYSGSDTTGKWYKATTTHNNPVIPASEEKIWLSNDKEQIMWQKSGLFTISRLLCPSLEKAKITAQRHGYE